MKTFLPRSVTARLLSVLALIGVAPGLPAMAAQPGRGLPQLNAAGFYETGDEMSRQVGGFFRRLFYGQDRNSIYAPPPGAQQPAVRPQSRGAEPPPNGINYQYAPAPVPPSTTARPPAAAYRRQGEAPPTTPAVRSLQSPTRTAEPKFPKYRESSPPTTNRSPAKKTTVTESKPVAKRQTSSSPRLAEPEPAQTKPAHKDTVLKAPVQDHPPVSSSIYRSEPTPVKSTPPATTKTDDGGLSPYAAGFGGASSKPVTESSAPATPPKQNESPQKDSKAPPGKSAYPTATKGTIPGRVISPYAPHNEIDVSGLPSGSLAIDPTTTLVFRVP